MDILKKILLFDVFPFLCRLIGSGLLMLGLYGIGFPPKNEIGTTSAFLLVLSLFFILLPLAKKISLGKLLTFEKEIEKVKTDVTEFKGETREILNVYSNTITAISNTMNQTVNVHLPGREQVQEAKEDLKSTIQSDDTEASLEDELTEYIGTSGNDLNFALARLRMDLEKSMRTILGKRTLTADPTAMKSKFMSARQLFKELTVQYPQYKGMHSSYDYVLKICNAAIHGQQVSNGHAEEALYMGLQMLNEFNRVQK
ncbi:MULTISPECIES: hypothetical protein [Vibrio]|nr:MULTISPECIES: hypothetical protein [Vibrio]MCR9859549.1 hypothetical protein [Vibrio parahaemolyticus]TOM93735.1 hypothetical protein CGH66_24480 [Vibrio parahaemolyticus]TON29193.1 hypothetical protein CGH59_24285 [Vibrio parahaemolyticus]TOO09074.1 hypothetical protein CGH43_24715 [Vibrio parahaemolyticus]